MSDLYSQYARCSWMCFSVNIMGGNIMKTLRTSRLITKQADSIFEFYLALAGVCLHENESSSSTTFLFNQSSFVWLNFNWQVLYMPACLVSHQCSLNAISISSLLILVPIGICPRDSTVLSVPLMIYNLFWNLASFIWLHILKQL